MSRTDYHKEIGFPNVDYPTGKHEVTATKHAKRESNKEEYGSFELPSRVNLTASMYDREPQEATGMEEGEQTIPHIFEVTVEDGEVVKIGARTHYNDKKDIVLIIDTDDWNLVTAWINLKGDYHATLNRQKYAEP